MKRPAPTSRPTAGAELSQAALEAALQLSQAALEAALQLEAEETAPATQKLAAACETLAMDGPFCGRRWRAGALRPSRGGLRKAAITKGELAATCATATELKKSDCFKVLSALTKVVQAELKKTGKVIVPGIVRMVTRKNPAKPARNHVMWGHVVRVKARPAHNIVKVFPVAALKQAI